MALSIDLEAARPVEALPISNLSKAHNAGNNRSDGAPATTLPTMQNSEIRKRLQQLQPAGNADENGDSLTTSAIELTPTSSETLEQTQESSRPVSWSTATLQQLRRGITLTKSSQLSKEDVDAFNHKHGYDQIKDEKVGQFPRGFPRLAAFQSSDDDFMIYRGFRRLHARELLQLEVEITLLEEELDRLDKEDDANDKLRYRLGKTKHEEGWDATQQKLRKNIRAKLREYDELLLKHSQIQRLGRPPQRNQRSLFDWVYGNQELSVGYFGFICHKNDFVSASGGAEVINSTGRPNYFEEWIRSHFTNSPFSIFKKFVRSAPLVVKPGEPSVDYYSSTKLSIFAKILLVSLAVGILLVPIYLLFLIPMERGEMAITVSAFMVLFCTVICSTTDAKTLEVFMATAAYGALLATFLQPFLGILTTI